jgi:hypothetical protein
MVLSLVNIQRVESLNDIVAIRENRRIDDRRWTHANECAFTAFVMLPRRTAPDALSWIYTRPIIYCRLD